MIADVRRQKRQKNIVSYLKETYPRYKSVKKEYDISYYLYVRKQYVSFMTNIMFAPNYRKQEIYNKV